MAENDLNKVKIRLKLRSGEEFEAEGSPDFIEKQRAEFLQLIGKQGKNISGTDWVAAPAPRAYPRKPGLKPAEPQNVVQPLTQPQTEPNPYPATGITPPGVAAAEHIRPTPPFPTATNSAEKANTALWEQIIRVDDGLVILRRKSRLLSAETAALLLIASAKVLLNEQNGYSALSLSKSLAKSGYGGGRLDRVLTAEMRQGTIQASGSKRSRAYLLSNEGFARAYVLANKIAGEWH